jgi:hypothetical protein
MHPEVNVNRSLAWQVPIVVVALACTSGRAQNAGDQDYLKAVTTVYAVSKVGAFVKDWCDDRVPQTKAVTARGLGAWRTAFKLDEVEARFVALVGEKRTEIDASLENKREAVYQGLDQNSKNPAQDCQGIETYLNKEVNPQKLYPNEYALAFSRPTPSQATSSQPSPSQNTPTQNTQPPPSSQLSARAQGTVYTVAQLGAIAENANRAKQDDEKALKALGAIFVKGTLVKPKERDKDGVVFLETINDTWRGTYSLNCYDLSLEKLYRNGVRALVLSGKVKETYSRIVKLEDCQVVTDASGLKPATVDDRAGLSRKGVKPERVMTKPNQGLKMAQLEGIVWNAEGEYTIGGYQFVERTYLLLKDGWLYDNLSFTPMDLDVTVSRQLEPQHWAQWKRQGKDVLVQWRDEDGQPKGTWKKLEGDFKAPFKPGTRLNGVFQAQSSYTIGTVSNGATSTSTTTYTFTTDGRYRFGYDSLTTGATDTGTGQDGASGVVTTGNGGASFGPNGTNASAFGSNSEEGTYSIDGYTLEFRSKTGKVTRTFAFLWDEQKYKDHVVIGGVTYSIPKK